MGPSPYAADPIHLNIDFLTEYRNDQQDKIDLVLLDPHYASSHHAVLTETGNDTGIFIKKIPEINQNDDPDNDVAYDSFEVKINYPLQYPDIINRVGESFERITADSAEIDYVKKNGEYLNDFDSDEEISEEERLHFPVWRGPDYEENDIKNYLISNMIFNQEDCANLDQTQFIPKNSKFKIRVLSDDNNIKLKIKSIIENENEIIDKKEMLELNGISAGVFETKYFFATEDIDRKGIKEELLRVAKNVGYGVFSIGKIVVVGEFGLFKSFIVKATPVKKCLSFIIPGKYRDYKLSSLIDADFYKTLIGNFQLEFLYPYIFQEIKNLGYTMVHDFSPTLDEIKEFFKRNSFKIWYISGHGSFGDTPDKFDGILINNYKSENNNVTEMKIDLDFLKKVNFSESSFEVVFFNACYSGADDTIQQYKDVLNTNIYLGWKSTVETLTADVFAFNLFYFSRGKLFSGDRLTFSEAYEKAIKKTVKETGVNEIYLLNNLWIIFDSDKIRLDNNY